MKIRPLQDRVIVKRLEEEEEKTKGGIIIPDTAKEKPQEGKVVAVGKGKVERRRQGHPARREGRRPHPVRQVLGHRDQARRRRAPHHARGRHPRRRRGLKKREEERHHGSKDREVQRGRARPQFSRGVNVLADAVTVTLGPRGPQRRAREVVRRAQRHQGRRDGGQGNRARGQVREHGRADGEGGRVARPPTSPATAPPRRPCWRAPSSPKAPRWSPRDTTR